MKIYILMVVLAFLTACFLGYLGFVYWFECDVLKADWMICL